jgi:hypothetical protein
MLAKGGQQNYTWTFSGDIRSDPAHPVATTLSDVYLVFPATTTGELSVCDPKSYDGVTSNSWAGYSGAAWRGSIDLQKKGSKWHLGYQANQQDADGGYLNLAVNDAASESTGGGAVTTTFTNVVGLVGAMSHFGAAYDAVDRCLTFAVTKTPVP